MGENTGTNPTLPRSGVILQNKASLLWAHRTADLRGRSGYGSAVVLPVLLQTIHDEGKRRSTEAQDEKHKKVILIGGHVGC